MPAGLLIPGLLAALGGCADEALPTVDEAPASQVSSAAPAALAATAVDPDAPIVTTLTATDDAQVNRLSFWANYGSSPTVEVDGYTKPEMSRGLIRFDQTAIAAAVGSKRFSRATLVLTQTRAAQSWGTPPTVDLFRLTSAWSEGTVTYSSLFGAGEPFDTAHPAARTVVQSGATGTISIDVSAEVAAFLAGTANNGWVVKDDGFANGASIAFASSEAADATTRPHLVIETLDGYDEDAAAVLTFGAAGQLIVDASTGRSTMTLPEHGLSFTDTASMVDWAIANLNARPVYNASGQRVGAELEELTMGDLQSLDADTGAIGDVDDPGLALLGGRDGYVTIAGVRTCVRDEVCGSVLQASQPAAIDRPCSTDGKYCIKAESFKRSFVIGNSIGTKLEQKDGGYHESHHACWKFWKAFRCTKKRGTNDLRIFNDYQVDVIEGIVNRVSRSAAGHNKTSIKQRLLKFGNAIQAEGVCAVSTGTDLGTHSLLAHTSKGSVEYLSCGEFQ
jgi:hypothetical protein